MKSAKIAIVPAISRLNCDFSLKTRDLLHIRPLPARFLRPFLWGVGKTSVQRARSSAVEHFVDIEGVTGSIPVSPTMYSLVWSHRDRTARNLGAGPRHNLEGLDL